jgi:aryl-alcohol dehydrogenase-like predicted oxidoreductase
VRELGIGFVAYSPLGRGFFTGHYRRQEDMADDDGRRRYPRFAPENLDTNLAILEPVEALAAEKGSTPAQVALAWVLAKGDDIVPIPGTKRRAWLEQNAGALDVELSEADIARLEAKAPRDAAIGTRYPEPLLAGLNR